MDIEAGKRLKYIRTKILGIDRQEDMAKLPGIDTSQAAIGHMERGKRKPTIKILEYLATHYNINASWVISGIGPVIFSARGEPMPPESDYEMASKLVQEVFGDKLAPVSLSNKYTLDTARLIQIEREMGRSDWFNRVRQTIKREIEKIVISIDVYPASH